MKIGLVCPYSVAKGGGVQEIVLASQAELTKRGHEVYILTPKPRDFTAVPSSRIIFIGRARDFNGRHTTIQVSASVNDTIDEILAEHNFDILHFHEPWVPMLSAQILSRSKCVNIATFHAKLPETIMTRTMFRVITPYTKSVLKYIDAFTAVSEAAAEYVCSLTAEPVALIPNGIDLKKYSPPPSYHDTKKKRKSILYIGRLEQRKGVKHLIHAFRLLSDGLSDVSLIIAGDGPDRQKLEALVRDLELKNVTFLGHITDDEKIRLLRSCDLFCSPALYGESFGIVLLEAMATGVVIVAGDNAGYASVLTGTGAISLINPKHYIDFSKRLNLLLYQQDMRDLWRTWARQHIKQYSYPAIIDQYEEVYRNTLEMHHARAEV